MPLNQDQEAAAEHIFSFLMSSDKEMSLSGPPGVGKTYLIQHIVQKLLPYYKGACKLMGLPVVLNEVKLTATTNRAADVLGGAMDHPSQTIHSLLGLRVYDDYETGKQKIERTRNSLVLGNKLILIDEASMVDRVLKKYLNELTDRTCKIIYVGDHCQLAPVGEKLSLVFSLPEIKTTKLLTPVRNAGSPDLMELCAQMRNTVEGGAFHPIPHVPGVINFMDADQAMQEVQQVFAKEGADSRILAWTNDQVNGYNGFIRELRGYGARLEDDELVVNNSAIEIGKGQSKTVLPAERELRVVRAHPGVVQIESGGQSVDAYEVELRDTKSHATYLLNQPIDRDHLKAVVKYFSRTKEWVHYFKFKNSFPDLRPRDASTVYKAQGGTFDSVYVDLGNIGSCHKSDEVARMLYVAVSRAKSQVNFFGKLPAKYGG